LTAGRQGDASMTSHDWIVLVGGVVFLILIVLLLRRAIRDVKWPGK